MLFFARRSAAELSGRKTNAAPAPHTTSDQTDAAAAAKHTTVAQHSTSAQIYTTAETGIIDFGMRISECGMCRATAPVATVKRTAGDAPALQFLVEVHDRSAHCAGHHIRGL